MASVGKCNMRTIARKQVKFPHGDEKIRSLCLHNQVFLIQNQQGSLTATSESLDATACTALGNPPLSARKLAATLEIQVGFHEVSANVPK